MKITEISVIIPVFNEQDSLEKLQPALKTELDKLKKSYEIIYVDDGSRDKSAQVIAGFAKHDASVKAVFLGGNLGQTAAISAGIDHAQGAVMVFMDADLQNDPADIQALLDKMEEGYDVVSGWRHKRKDPFLSRRFFSIVANWIISKVTGVRLHDYGCSLKAYKAGVIKDISLYGEMHRFIPALAKLTGASIAEIKVSHHSRKHGKSKYGLERIFKVACDLITVKFLLSYSTKPLYMFGFWGFLSIATAIVLVISGFVFLIDKAGLMGGIFLVLGVQLILMGLLSEIMVRIYHESHLGTRKIYRIKNKLNLP